MSKFYYETQRKEDIGSLQAMFGPPWTYDLLGVVLDYYDGNVDEAVNRLLVLNDHHNGNPQPLVEQLLLSGPPARAHARHAPTTTAELLQARSAVATMAAIPKSKLKKPPPPRSTKMTVTMADTSTKATITIKRQTRRRIGTPIKLPKGFLRIPKSHKNKKHSSKAADTPLFNPKTLDQLELPPPEPLSNVTKIQETKPNVSDNLRSTPLTSTAVPTPTTFQTLRSSMNFPSFPTTTKSDNTSVSKTQNPPKRRFFPQTNGGDSRARNYSQDSGGSNGSSASSNLLSNMKFPVPKMPKMPPLSTKPANGGNKKEAATPNGTANANLKTAPPGPAPPPMDMFARANDDGHWFSPSSADASPFASENNLLSNGSYNYPPPPSESAPPEEAPTATSSSKWNLPGLSQTKTAEDARTADKKRWSLPVVTVPTMSLSKKTDETTATNSNGATENHKPGSNRWNFPSMGASLKTPTATHQSDPLPEKASPLETTARRWTLASVGTALKTSSMNATTTSPSSAVADKDTATGSTSDYADTYGSIPQVEFRGISLRQLKQLVENMRHHCVIEQWKSVETGRGIQPRQVTMYDLVKHYIIPQTQGNACSFVEQAFGKDHYEHGLPRPPQWFVSHTWSDSVIDLVQCIEQHAVDRGLDADDTAKYWISVLSVNQHKLGANVLADLDKLSDDSMLQDPRMTQRVLQVTEGMLCVIDKNNLFFSRIWCLWELFLAFEQAKAGVSVGVASGDDDDRYRLDVYSLNDEGTSVGLTDGMAAIDKYRPSKEANNDTATASQVGLQRNQLCNEVEWSQLRVLRQSQFRFQTCFEALGVQLESSHASLEDDTRRIMNCIVQHKGINTDAIDHTHDAEALTVHPAYSHVNAMIQGTFAGLVYRHALEQSLSDKAEDDQGMKEFKRVQRALSGSSINSLEVSFAGCKAFQIREALKFVESLPTSLRRLDLDYSFTDFLYGEEFAIGFSRLSQNLEVFKLNCAFCSRLENLDRLWEELGSLTNLKHLTLVVHPNKNLTSVDGLTDALNNMQKLERLELEFDCFGGYQRMVTMAKGEATMNNISSMFRSSDSSRQAKELSDQFDQVPRLAQLDINGSYISDSSIQRLCRSIKSRTLEVKIKTVKLRFLGDLGKKLKNVETVEDLTQALERFRNGLKLFS